MNIDYSRVITAETSKKQALEAARSVAVSRALQQIEAAALKISGQVPVAEQLTWAAKESAARLILSGDEAVRESADYKAAVDLLTVEAGMMNETPELLAPRILAAAEAYRADVSRLSGIRRANKRALADAQTEAEIREAMSVLQELLAPPTEEER